MYEYSIMAGNIDRGYHRMRIKAGIIGCGGIANGKHMPSIKATGEIDLVAFCDIIKERADKAALEYGASGAKVFTDYKELLELDLDAVYVCTPNRSHSFITVDALHSGKHVMCEKPMAINATEAKKMLDAAIETGKVLTIGYQNRFRPDSQYLKKACKQGDLGDIYFAKANAIRRRAVPTWGVFLNEYEQGGGPLIDIGTHALDLTLWMMENYQPKYVVGATYHKLNNDTQTGNAWGDWDREQFTVEDSAFGFIMMKNGASIMLSSSWALNTLEVEEAATVLSGTKGGADMHDGLRINGVKFGRQYVEKPDLVANSVDYYRGSDEKPQVLEQRAFIRALRGEGKPVVLPEEALMVTQILDAVYESSRTGKPVYFD